MRSGGPALVPVEYARDLLDLGLEGVVMCGRCPGRRLVLVTLRACESLNGGVDHGVLRRPVARRQLTDARDRLGPKAVRALGTRWHTCSVYVSKAHVNDPVRPEPTAPRSSIAALRWRAEHQRRWLGSRGRRRLLTRARRVVQPAPVGSLPE